MSDWFLIAFAALGWIGTIAFAYNAWEAHRGWRAALTGWRDTLNTWRAQLGLPPIPPEGGKEA